MKAIFPFLLLFGSFSSWLFSCTDAPTISENNPIISTKKIDSIPLPKTIIDPRDGEVYPIVTIGKQTWMAENMRYNAPNSMINPENPSIAYGRLYDGISAQSACPSGWHLPTDTEWNELEIHCGMPPTDTIKEYWRGEHGLALKSTYGWLPGNNGIDKYGFNGLPAGYYFSGTHGGEVGMDGLGGTGGFWCAAMPAKWTMEKGIVTKAWIRFLAAPKLGVNRFDDAISSGFAMSCRCVKD